MDLNREITEEEYLQDGELGWVPVIIVGGIKKTADEFGTQLPRRTRIFSERYLMKEFFRKEGGDNSETSEEDLEESD